VSEPLDEVSKSRNLWHQNRGDSKITGMSTEGPVYWFTVCVVSEHMRHDLYLGC
jgi:hypothetical protein